MVDVKANITGMFTRTSFVVVRRPKWLVPINNLARLFGLMVTPIGKPIKLSDMTFIEGWKGIRPNAKNQGNTKGIAGKAD